MSKHRRLLPWGKAWKVFDRTVAVVVYGAVACLAVALVGSLVAGAVGGKASRGTFGFGGLWIQYEIRTGGLRSDRLDYVIVRHDLPEIPKPDKPSDMDRLFLTGKALRAVQPDPGQTVWIDREGHVTPLGQALSLADVKRLRRAGLANIPPITTPEEFLAALAKLKAGSGR